VLFRSFLMLGLPADTWLRLAVWLVVGLAIYAFYGIRHSRVGAPAASKVTPLRAKTGKTG